MQKIKVSVVSYLNSKPFIYGLEHSTVGSEISLQQDIPADCAKNLLEDRVDVGLIPVAVIPLLKESYIIGDFCIGAVGKVSSVCLYSNVPLEQIDTVLLDHQSRTSVTLVKILAKEWWKIKPLWAAAGVNFENKIEGRTAAVIIGDRTFGIKNKYKYTYDLAEEWQKLTGLPFVFACWVANKKMSSEFVEKFNAALRVGIDRIPLIAQELSKSALYDVDIEEYFRKYISYQLDEEKKKGLALFLEYLKKLN